MPALYVNQLRASKAGHRQGRMDAKEKQRKNAGIGAPSAPGGKGAPFSFRQVLETFVPGRALSQIGRISEIGLACSRNNIEMPHILGDSS